MPYSIFTKVAVKAPVLVEGAIKLITYVCLAINCGQSGANIPDIVIKNYNTKHLRDKFLLLNHLVSICRKTFVIALKTSYLYMN